jgi:ADP-ribose pyrophosphatase YjhB (NUDIX family)
MTDTRFLLRCAVYLILIRDDKILLLKRFNTGWQDGNYSLPAGHIDGGERIYEGMIREAKEEIGIDIEKKDLEVVHTIHRKARLGMEYFDIFLIAKNWKGIPSNMEENKCSGIGWFPLDNLPKNLLPYVKQAIINDQKKIFFSDFGWNGDAI